MQLDAPGLLPPRTARLVACVVALALLAFCLGVLAADITPQPGGGVPTPTAPSLIAPKGIREGAAGTTLSLEWRQSLNSPGRTPAADYFAICVFEAGVQDCASTSRNWMVAAPTIPRMPISSGSLYGSAQVIGYAYAFQLPNRLTDTELDRQLQWTVGACATAARTSCTFAPAANVWLSTKNLAVRSTSGGDSTPEYFRVSGIASNEGTDAGPFANELWIWQAVPTSLGHDCINDVNLEWADFAFTRAGAILEVASLPRHADGSVDTGNHSIEAVLSREWFDQPVHLHRADASLLSGEERAVVGNGDTLPLRDRPVDGISYTFVTLFFVDAADAIVEFDDSDNLQAECHVVYR